MIATTRKFDPAAAACGLLAFTLTAGMAQAQLRNVLPFAPLSVSTVPSNGDVNPYGVAYVPGIHSDGMIQPAAPHASPRQTGFSSPLRLLRTVPGAFLARACPKRPTGL